jgi:hypothetical protein
MSILPRVYAEAAYTPLSRQAEDASALPWPVCLNAHYAYYPRPATAQQRQVWYDLAQDYSTLGGIS